MAKNDSQDGMVDGLDLPNEEGSRSLVLTYIKIVFIPVVLYLIFLAGYLEIVSFKVQIHSIIMMGILLFIALIFARHNAEFGCCIFQRHTNIFKAELKEYIMSHLLAVGKRKKSNAPFDMFIEKFTSNLRNDNYASVAAGIFPMLGILGTFISIAISMPNFSSSNIDALEGEIAQLLGGVGTAFYVSIYGIFLALWWIYFEKKGISKFQKFIQKYKNATKEFFWDRDEISQSLMLEILNRNEKIANSFEKIFNTEFNDKLTESMGENYKTFKTMTELQSSMLETTKKGLSQNSMLFYTLEQNSSNLTNRYDKTINSLDILLSGTNTLYGNLTRQFDRLSKLSEQNIANFEGSMSHMLKELRNLNITLNNATHQVFNAQNEATKSYQKSIEKSVDEIRDVFNSVNSNTSIAEELKKSLDNIDKESKAIIEKMEKDRHEGR
ncbi:MAG: hypothetical protein GXZ15_06715 [Campylobacter sp.]|nr:hypothetical protein [Campylobacter sp.]